MYASALSIYPNFNNHSYTSETVLSYPAQVWSFLLYLCGYNHFVVCSILPWACVNIFYWSFIAFFSFLDLTGRPRCLAKYKIQPDKNRPIDVHKFKRAVALGLFNQIVVSFHATCACESQAIISQAL